LVAMHKQRDTSQETKQTHHIIPRSVSGIPRSIALAKLAGFSEANFW
jgi:hypothetical protein